MSLDGNHIQVQDASFVDDAALPITGNADELKEVVGNLGDESHHQPVFAEWMPD